MRQAQVDEELIKESELDFFSTPNTTRAIDVAAFIFVGCLFVSVKRPNCICVIRSG